MAFQRTVVCTEPDHLGEPSVVSRVLWLREGPLLQNLWRETFFLEGGKEHTFDVWVKSNALELTEIEGAAI